MKADLNYEFFLLNKDTFFPIFIYKY